MITIKTTNMTTKIKSMETLKREDMIVENETYITESINYNKHLQNILYGVWEDEYEEETLLCY